MKYPVDKSKWLEMFEEDGCKAEEVDILLINTIADKINAAYAQGYEDGRREGCHE